MSDDGIVVWLAQSPREGWEEAFARMAKSSEDRLLDESFVSQNAWTRTSGSGRKTVWCLSHRPQSGDRSIVQEDTAVPGDLSLDEIDRHLRAAIVAPMTTQRHSYPSRVSCTFEGKKAEIVLDQIRAVDVSRLVRRLGRVGIRTQEQVLDVLAELFAA